MFGKILKTLRKKNNLSQKQLADAIDVAPSTISMYEKGKRSPNDELLKKIATYFDTSIDYLLGHKRKSGKISDYTNDELDIYLEKLRNDPEIRILFDVASRATKEQLNAAIAFLEIMEKK